MPLIVIVLQSFKSLISGDSLLQMLHNQRGKISQRDLTNAIINRHHYIASMIHASTIESKETGFSIFSTSYATFLYCLVLCLRHPAIRRTC